MEDTTREKIEILLKGQRNYFSSHQTKNVDFRIESLTKFKAAILKYESKISDALYTDLRKSYEEAYMTEISIVLQEIDNHIKNLRRWVKPKRAKTPIYLFPSSSKTIYEPLGIALIFAPWNYPFQLLMNSLVGAISAGCCVILKPSPYTPTVAKVMEELIQSAFESQYIGIVQGGRKVNEILFHQRFDIIFFTGSPAVGRVVMKAAAENLTPVVLELGGKSPCIVDADANIDIAAKRIAWGKTINAGQSCIAPDYLFAHHSIKKKLIEKIATNLQKMYGTNIKLSPYYPRIVNQQAVERLQKLMLHGKIVFGGEVDINEKYLSPTIIDDVKTEFPVMQEEIFGPILPVLTFKYIQEVLDYVNANEKPLAFYYFGSNANAKDVFAKTTSGGGCINDTMLHITNHDLPFGGVGNSGMGKYHGHESFLAFSNSRGIVNSPTWLDIPLKYAPFKNFKLLKKFI
ncbi:MAG: aldehyde dehydrogenase [Bacteroidetes bacterium]|nr:aldehyde dehydrogenase [Bacteroidota bacterium]